MIFTALDWIIIAAYLAFVLYIGLRYKGEASKDLTSFFLGGRKLPWYIAGISMVATTFAADTPLWVAEKVSQHGISGNWLWWNMLTGGMLTAFFFSRLWRRAGVVTELEFIELRYSGRAAALLRGFKSVYMGVFLNGIIIGWVNTAMITILHVFFDISLSEAFWYTGGLMLLVAVYSTLSGLIGVALTDAIQFMIAMGGCIVLAFVALNQPEVGGLHGLVEKLPAWRFDFFPRIQTDGSIADTIGTYSITLGAFLTFMLVQWWASWYPGAEPGGGGYVSQRMMSAKNEKHAVLATLFFQVAHYCLRPWPWIIVGLCALLLYPDLPVADASKGFVFVMKDLLPSGLKGLLFVAFLSAYMSTISTQLNWGASYLTNDLYRRFIRREDSFENQEKADTHYVSMARYFTLLLVLLAFGMTAMIDTIDQAATFLIECGAGLGLVLILRWYWWRINAWSEVTATIAPLGGWVLANKVLHLDSPQNFLVTAGFTTVAWLTATFLTQPESRNHLQAFYDRVRPGGAWKPFRNATNQPDGNGWALLGSWLTATVFTYSLLFLIGSLLFRPLAQSLTYAFTALISLAVFFWLTKSSKLFSD
ncbi:MAG: Na+:solute symporter [Flavobacteriales bacterium]|nr:Na+:solute symporter [Flavobacteriales bacterium]MCB9448585.1 Na+:solute symporter [Flavobacteriales bacterium]